VVALQKRKEKKTPANETLVGSGAGLAYPQTATYMTALRLYRGPRTKYTWSRQTAIRSSVWGKYWFSYRLLDGHKVETGFARLTAAAHLHTVRAAVASLRLGLALSSHAGGYANLGPCPARSSIVWCSRPRTKPGCSRSADWRPLAATCSMSIKYISAMQHVCLAFIALPYYPWSGSDERLY
jgi:hypothetical protein